jgi:hypothetical protein
MNKLSFAGHESFHCRSLWLKKGFDFVSDQNDFNEPSSVISLGVGKNMVSSINYWLFAFGLLKNNGQLSELATFLLSEEGYDPYLEDNASLWLLHYNLICENKASIYSIIFNEFRKQRVEFNRHQLLNYLLKKCKENNFNSSENTLKRDIAVFLKMYVKPKNITKNLEDLYSGLFIDLNIIEQLKKFDEDERDWYKIENNDRDDIPVELFLYILLNNPNYSDSISFDKLLFDTNSPGNILAMNSAGVLKKIHELTQRYHDITFTDDAGIRELQIKKRPDKWKELKKYYEK